LERRRAGVSGRMRWGLLLAALTVSSLLAVPAPAETTAEPRIVGGHEVSPPGAYPFVVTLVERGSPAYQGQICGGSLIAPEWVLTAAHCVQGRAASAVDVVIGRHDLRSSDGERIRVASIRVHPNFDSHTLARDVALIRLSRPTLYLPADLPTDASLEIPGSPFTVVGWGVTRAGSATLQEVDVPLVPAALCRQAYGSDFLAAVMICAGDFENGGIDTCFGDSGGPLFAEVADRFALVGVVSWGYDCAQPGEPGVYTRVSALRPWIAKVSGVGTACVTCAGLEATIVGTEGDDVIMGTPRADIIAALGGNDTVFGSGGDDLICGGDGDDRLVGGAGDDRIFGGAGADVLEGRDGADLLYGEGGMDLLIGGLGDDTLIGGEGVDTGRGGPGADLCTAESVASCEA
jgi:trypsin